jgi:uncharacterized membrane protein YfcA
MDWVGFYAAAIPAVIFTGLSKGGFQGISMISVPLIALVVPPVQAAAIMLPVLLVQDVVSVSAYWKVWDPRNVAILLPSAAVGILGGYLFAAHVPTAGIQLALGLFSLIIGAQQLIVLARALVPPASPAGVMLGFICGAALGFTSMILHAGAPPYQYFVLRQRLPRDVFVGTGVIVFAVVNLIKVPPFIALGQFTRENLMTSVSLIPVAVAATWAGVLLVRRVRPDRFFAIISALMILVGAELAWEGWTGLLAGAG